MKRRSSSSSSWAVQEFPLWRDGTVGVVREPETEGEEGKDEATFIVVFQLERWRSSLVEEWNAGEVPLWREEIRRGRGRR